MNCIGLFQSLSTVGLSTEDDGILDFVQNVVRLNSPNLCIWQIHDFVPLSLLFYAALS